MEAAFRLNPLCCHQDFWDAQQNEACECFQRSVVITLGGDEEKPRKLEITNKKLYSNRALTPKKWEKKTEIFLKMLLMLLPPINKISFCHFHTLCRLARFCVSSGFAPNKNMELVGKKKTTSVRVSASRGFLLVLQITFSKFRTRRGKINNQLQI